MDHILDDDPAWLHHARVTYNLKRNLAACFRTWPRTPGAAVVRTFRGCQKKIDRARLVEYVTRFDLFDTPRNYAGLGKIVGEDFSRERPGIDTPDNRRTHQGGPKAAAASAAEHAEGPDHFPLSKRRWYITGSTRP